MVKKHNKILHYLLIIVLMVAPVRSLLAAPSCHMQDMAADMSADMSEDMSADMQHDMSSHDMSGHDMSAHAMSDTDQQQGVSNKCCCCDDDCNSQCDMGLSAALMLQASSYMPVFVNAVNAVSVSPQVLVRALTPPSRPPAQLS